MVRRRITGIAAHSVDGISSSAVLAEGTFYGSDINGIELIWKDDSADYQTIDGSLYTGDGKTLLAYFPTEINEDYTFVPTEESQEHVFHVPEGVESITPYAFFNCGLSRIYLPATVTEIGDHAFTRSGIDPDSEHIVDMDGNSLDLFTLNVSDTAFDKWSMTYESSDDPEIPAAIKLAGYEYEEMYGLIDHGLFTELTRGRICGNLLLYSGVTQAYKSYQ